MNSILKSKHDTSNNFEFLNQDIKKPVPSDETSIFLNQFFANGGKRKEPASNHHADRIVNGYEIGNVDLDEVKLLIRQIDVSKDSCIEGIAPNILNSVLFADDCVLYSIGNV